MAELVAVPLGNGGVIVVEMDYTEAGVVKAGRPGQVVGKAAQTLEAALESVTPAVQSILAKLRQGATIERLDKPATPPAPPAPPAKQ